MEIIIGLGISVAVNFYLFWKLTKIREAALENTVTEAEIRQMVDAGEDSGSIDENEKEMINNILELRKISAGEIATHRTDIVAIAQDAALDEIMTVLQEEKYSRIVVYDENIDDIIGVVHVKDLMKYILADIKRMEDANFHIRELLMEPYFVPFSKKVDELFEEMQLAKVHMAIIIDEYGGTEGIVTMEDIMEEIVGNISDEYDIEEEEDITMLSETEYRINGTTDLKDVAELFELTFEDEEDYDTLGGYLIGQLGRIPEDDEQPEIQIGGCLFRIESIEEKRIEKVYAVRLPEEEAPAEEEE